MRPSPRLSLALLTALCGSALLNGCGSDNSQLQAFRVGGNVTGLSAGDQVTLEMNGGDALTVKANGGFMFPVSVRNNGAYSVTAGTQPVGKTCSVTNGSGVTNGRDVANVAVVCAVETFPLTGTVSGLQPNTQVVLQNNGADPVSVSGSGSFAFATPIAYGGSYDVTVGPQPSMQMCTVSNGTGGPVQANPGSVHVLCSLDAYTVGGRVGGLTTSGLVLQDNGGDALAVTTGSSNFQFAQPIASGSTYNVTVLQQPTGEVCTVSSGANTVGSANVTTVSVSCAPSAPTISCSASPATVSSGQSTVITSMAVSPAGLPLTYSYSSTAGSISGNTATATLDTTGAAPGTVSVMCAVVDDRGNFASASTTVLVLP